MEEYPDEKKKMEKRCKSCRYFCPYVYDFGEDEPNGGMVSDYGECRRFPPKLVADEESGFPVVEENAWCGEFDF